MIGVYGVLSFETIRRTREIGIRGALGATETRIARMVLRDAAKLAGVGILIGLPAAVAGTRLIRGLLYATDPTDPVVYAAVIACIVLVSLTAAYVPARRATRIDPLDALRAE